MARWILSKEKRLWPCLWLAVGHHLSDVTIVWVDSGWFISPSKLKILCVAGELMVEMKFTAPDVKTFIQFRGACTLQSINWDPEGKERKRGETHIDRWGERSLIEAFSSAPRWNREFVLRERPTLTRQRARSILYPRRDPRHLIGTSRSPRCPGREKELGEGENLRLKEIPATRKLAPFRGPVNK